MGLCLVSALSLAVHFGSAFHVLIQQPPDPARDEVLSLPVIINDDPETTLSICEGGAWLETIDAFAEAHGLQKHDADFMRA